MLPVIYEKTSDRPRLVGRSQQVPIHFQAGFEQLSQEAAVPVWMRTTESERLSKTLRHNKEQKMISVSAAEGAEKVLVVTPAMDDLFLQLNVYNVSKKIWSAKNRNKMLLKTQ